MRLLRATVFLALFVPFVAHAQKPWPIRAVIVVTFEIGNDTGDAPGEFQFWVEREHLDQTIAFPGGPAGPDGTAHPLRTNKDHTILGMVSGTTLVNATASMMALGLDPRFDLTHAYFLINGIAGIDPHIASIGSAAWARYVIGDVAREIDPREAPKDWPYGIFPTGAKRPNPPTLEDAVWHRSNLFTLNQSLVQWAYDQTRSLELPDDPTVAAFRAQYTQTPAAQRPPFVLLGDTFASDYYWHGTIMTKYAEDWVRLWTSGRGVFATTEMEDSGFLNAIERLDDMHRVDRNRVLVLRTGSNYSMERPGHDAVESVSAPYIGKNLALESAYLVGSTVLHNLVNNWATTRDHIPGD
ncbi:MAG TPA: purine nucleoside permease [Candidatus Aquilonibacter sp.]|nr:purine nucleoside permease [Candidatus Aquilonibacter sp.]